MKFLKTIPAALLMAVALVACDDDETMMTQTPVTLRSQSIAEGASVLAGMTTQLTLSYNYHMAVNEAAGVTVNGTAVTPTIDGADVKNVLIPLELEAGTEYTISVPAGAFYNADNSSMTSGAFTVKFSTVEGLDKNLVTTSLVNSNATQQAKNVYNFLLEQYTTRTLSGVMANVDNDNEFADLVNTTTGKYPALTGYDFIHLAYSPCDWVDYNNITPAQTQWNNNGLVTYMWHWNTPSNEGDAVDTYNANSDFDIEAALTEGTWQHDFIMADIAEVAGYLKLLQDAGIPVIWRPLHEAAGNYDLYGSMADGAWFWWGKKGPEATKQLWKLLYDQLVNVHGLNNLIWVWTVQVPTERTEEYLDDAIAAYPGDEYVDIIGVDIYADNIDSKKLQFDFATAVADGKKMVTLSECGNVPNPETCFNSGEAWSWFMVWYNTDEDGNILLNTEDANYSLNTAEYWSELMNSEYVITRDEMPGDLK